MFPVINYNKVSDLETPIVLLDMNKDFYSDNAEFKSNIDVVIQAFLLLLSVPKNSRWWRPEYGSLSLYDLLFEPYDKTTADAIADAIEVTGNSAANGNRRLSIDSISVKLTNQQVYLVELKVSIAGFGPSDVKFGLKKLN